MSQPSGSGVSGGGANLHHSRINTNSARAVGGAIHSNTISTDVDRRLPGQTSVATSATSTINALRGLAPASSLPASLSASLSAQQAGAATTASGGSQGPAGINSWNPQAPNASLVETLLSLGAHSVGGGGGVRPEVSVPQQQAPKLSAMSGALGNSRRGSISNNSGVASVPASGNGSNGAGTASSGTPRSENVISSATTAPANAPAAPAFAPSTTTHLQSSQAQNVDASMLMMLNLLGSLVPHNAAGNDAMRTNMNSTCPSVGSNSNVGQERQQQVRPANAYTNSTATANTAAPGIAIPSDTQQQQQLLQQLQLLMTVSSETPDIQAALSTTILLSSLINESQKQQRQQEELERQLEEDRKRKLRDQQEQQQQQADLANALATMMQLLNPGMAQLPVVTAPQQQQPPQFNPQVAAGSTSRPQVQPLVKMQTASTTLAQQSAKPQVNTQSQQQVQPQMQVQQRQMQVQQQMQAQPQQPHPLQQQQQHTLHAQPQVQSQQPQTHPQHAQPPAQSAPRPLQQFPVPQRVGSSIKPASLKPATRYPIGLPGSVRLESSVLKTHRERKNGIEGNIRRRSDRKSKGLSGKSNGSSAATKTGQDQQDPPPTESVMPCRARGMPIDHNYQTAYFVVPSDTHHGAQLVCSYPACRNNGIKFRWCQVCLAPVANRNFRGRHSHPEELEWGRKGDDTTSSKPNKSKQASTSSKNALGTKRTKKDRHDIAPLTRSSTVARGCAAAAAIPQHTPSSTRPLREINLPKRAALSKQAQAATVTASPPKRTTALATQGRQQAQAPQQQHQQQHQQQQTQPKHAPAPAQAPSSSSVSQSTLNGLYCQDVSTSQTSVSSGVSAGASATLSLTTRQLAWRELFDACPRHPNTTDEQVMEWIQKVMSVSDASAPLPPAVRGLWQRQNGGTFNQHTISECTDNSEKDSEENSHGEMSNDAFRSPQKPIQDKKPNGPHDNSKEWEQSYRSQHGDEERKRSADEEVDAKICEQQRQQQKQTSVEIVARVMSTISNPPIKKRRMVHLKKA